METQMREKHGMFSYIYQKSIQRKHQLPNFAAPTGRRHQPLDIQTQPEGIYNTMNSLAPIRKRLKTHDSQA
jgi:hypothetical protein